MKKISFPATLLIIGLLIPFLGHSQPQLSFRMTNPRVYWDGVSSFLEWDVEVKCDSSNRFLQAMTAAFHLYGTGLSTSAVDLSIVRGPQYTGNDSQGNPKYTASKNITGVGTKKISLGLSSDPLTDLIPTTSADYSEILTTWHTMFTGRLKINDATQLAGVLWWEVQFSIGAFRRPSQTTNLPFLTPHQLDTKTFRYLYLGRLFNSLTGWTQVGGTVNWAITANTSVWDSVATLNTTAALATKLRIHPVSPTPGTNQVATLPGGRLKILPGGQLTCSDSTIIDEPKGLWISSDASGTGSFIDNGTIVYNTGGTVLAQRFLAPNKWHGYCIPLTQTTTLPYKDYFMKYYDNTVHHYRYVINPALDSLLNSDGIGYMMWSSSGSTNLTPVSPVGQLNTGAMTIPVTRPAYPGAPGADFDDWNFIGNPYPSAVDLASASITWNNVIQEAYFWNPGIGNYTVYIKAGGGVHSQYAPAQQGFFVRHDTASSIATTFVYANNTVRVHNSEAFLKEELADLLQIKAVNSSNGFADLGNIRFAEGTIPGLDENVDALKLSGDENAPQIYFPVPGGFDLQVNVLPWVDKTMTVPMSFRMLSSATNEISVEGIESFKSGTQVYLEDTKDTKMQDMVANPTYQFTSTSQDDPARFLWHFTKSTIGIEDPALSAMQIYSFDQNVYVKNLVKGTTRGVLFIYDLTGRTVFTADLKDMPLNKFNPGVVGGYYVARVVTNDHSYTQKLYLN
jgi:hypothetical protein